MFMSVSKTKRHDCESWAIDGMFVEHHFVYIYVVYFYFKAIVNSFIIKKLPDNEPEDEDIKNDISGAAK